MDKFDLSHLDTAHNHVYIDIKNSGDQGVSKEGKLEVADCNLVYGHEELKTSERTYPRRALVGVRVNFNGMFYDDKPVTKQTGVGMALKSLGGESVPGPVTIKEVNKNGKVLKEIKLEDIIAGRDIEADYNQSSVSTGYTLYSSKITVDIKEGPMKGTVVWNHAEGHYKE